MQNVSEVINLYSMKKKKFQGISSSTNYVVSNGASEGLSMTLQSTRLVLV